VPKLSGRELAEFRDWFERYLEENLELRDEIRAELDEAWGDIRRGEFTTRQTPPA
jgi:hypothetical protein